MAKRYEYGRTRLSAWGIAMRKALPATMFGETDQARITTLRNWVLDHQVTVIEMTERQFWNFALLQPVAEKPWTTFMGRPLRVPNMPVPAQIVLGIEDNTVAPPIKVVA